MKKLIALSLMVAVALGLTVGCTTTNPTTGEKVYDPVKTEKVCAVMKEAIANGVLIGLSKEPKAAAGLVLAQQVVCDLSGRTAVSPQTVNEALLGLDLKALENADARLVVQLSVNTLLGLYNAALADRLRADVNADVYAKNILDTLCVGLTQGLAQAKASGIWPAPPQ